MKFEYAHISIDIVNGGVVENTTGSAPGANPEEEANNAGADRWEAWDTLLINDGTLVIVNFKRATGA